MIPLSQARMLALAAVRAGRPARVPLLEALGCFLAEAVVSPRASPALDNSAMDGFAVQFADTRGAKHDRPALLKVIGSIFAGSRVPDRDVRAGEAYRIFTGAPIPYGADAVVRMEAARDDSHTAAIFIEEEPGANIRRRGEEYPEGALLFPAGQRVDAAVVGVLASIGRGEAPVRQRPRVAVLTVGDELIPPGRPAEPHQIYDSDAPLIASLAIEAGAKVSALERARDEDEAIRAALERLLASADLVVTSGGASVGMRDRVKHAVKAMGGTLGFDGVALKPGKPASVALVRRMPIAILPGNPGAATVGFDQLARPLLLKMQGVVEVRRKERARIDSPRRKQAGLTYLVGARLERRQGELWAALRATGPGQILPNVGVDGWAVMPPGKSELAAGEEVEVELFHGASYHLLPPGDLSEEITR
ncbi:MAG: molybdopterin molybdotransferase MoeA [Myxococcales bacterium]|nr:molybdopterin molybdotransferase MoeA [Myxococcales bacterium]